MRECLEVISVDNNVFFVIAGIARQFGMFAITALYHITVKIAVSYCGVNIFVTDLIASSHFSVLFVLVFIFITSFSLRWAAGVP